MIPDRGFWMRCQSCDHCWIAAYAPADGRSAILLGLRDALRLYRKRRVNSKACPRCRSASVRPAHQEDGFLKEPLPPASAHRPPEGRGRRRRADDPGAAPRARPQGCRSPMGHPMIGDYSFEATHESGEESCEVLIWFEVTDWGYRGSRSEPSAAPVLEFTGCTDLDGTPRPDLEDWAISCLDGDYHDIAQDAAEGGASAAKWEHRIAAAKERRAGL